MRLCPSHSIASNLRRPEQGHEGMSGGLLCKRRDRVEPHGWTQAGRCPGFGHRGLGLSQWTRPHRVQVGSGGTVPSVGQALTEVQSRSSVRGAEPGQGQQDEAGGQKKGQEVKQQQEAKEGEVGLDSGAEEACGEQQVGPEAPSRGPS